jgi:hypothetical protein
MGLYRFTIQGWPLADALREIERHRGLRPKASVTLLYNRILPQLAPERAANDVTARRLRDCAAGVTSPVAQVVVRDRIESVPGGSTTYGSEFERR